MGQVVCKMLFEDNKALFKPLMMLIERINAFQKIFCNIYNDIETPSKSESGISQIEASRRLTAYSYIKVERLLGKRLNDGQPFFLDVYSTGGPSITVIRIEAYVLLYLCIEDAQFLLGEQPIVEILQSVFEHHKGMAAYACMARDNWWLLDNPFENAHWRHAMYKRYSHVGNNTARLFKRLSHDEIWFPACWRIWLSKDVLGEVAYQKLLSYKNGYAMQVLANERISLQLYKNMADYARPGNLLRCREFYIYLGQYYPDIW